MIMTRQNLESNHQHSPLNLRFTELWQAHRDSLLAFLRSRLDNSAEAQDLLAAIGEKFYHTLARQPEPDNVRAWLFTCARHAIIDHYRKVKPLQQDMQQLAQSATQHDAIDSLMPCLKPFMQRLPAKYGDILKRSAIAGEIYPHIAKDLGLSTSAVKSRVSRARAMLLQQFERCCEVDRDRRGAITAIRQKSHCDASCQ